jgi:galactokinase
MLNEPDHLLPLLDRTCEEFRRQFDRAPRWAACAPGRVNLIGEHVDYNQGYVLPMAIERYTVAVAAARPVRADEAEARDVRLYSCNRQQTGRIELPAGRAPRARDWTAYVQGVLAGFEELGHELAPLDVVIDSSVPLGGGLSSSASLEVAVATLLESVTGTQLGPLHKIRLCQTAEHTFAGVPCGIMDQFATSLARVNHLMLLDCRTLDCQPIPLEPPAPCVLIINTNVRHELGASQYASRRAECQQAAAALGVESLREATLDELLAHESELPTDVLRRARHVISEIERTRDAARCIRQRDWRQAGELMYQSHQSLRNDYEVSCPELDALVEWSEQLGVTAGIYGSRMTGAGFGGCTVSLVEEASVQHVSSWLSDRYRARFGIEPSCFVTRPAAGARSLSVER